MCISWCADRVTLQSARCKDKDGWMKHCVTSSLSTDMLCIWNLFDCAGVLKLLFQEAEGCGHTFLPHLHWRWWTPCMVRQWNTFNTQLGWNPLRWSYAFCRARRKPENMNQVLCWTTKAPVKGVAPAVYFCSAPRPLCVLFVSVHSYLSSAVCSPFEDDFYVHCITLKCVIPVVCIWTNK